MTLRDPEVIEALRDEPELLALADAFADTQRLPRRRWTHRPLPRVLAVAGVALTISDSLGPIVLGLAGLTAGFFAVHGIASGWVAARAHAAGASSSQAAAFYLISYYAGSSVFGSLGGVAWSRFGWTGPVALAMALLVAVGALSLDLRRIPVLSAGT